FFLERGQHPDKRFLLRVLDEGGRAEARTKLQRQQIAEVLGDVPFCLRVFGNQPTDVVAVETEARAQGQRKNPSLRPAATQPSASISLKRSYLRPSRWCG